MTTTTTAGSAAYTGNGQGIDLGLSTALISTPFFASGFLTAKAVLGKNKIVAFDGLPGTGKTTCARYVAQHTERPCAVATMPHRPAPLDILRHVHAAITGTPPKGTRYEMQNDLAAILTAWQGVLIIDELQNTKANGLQELVWLYEETNHAFGLVVVGTGVLQSVQHYPQLHSRIMGHVTFQPLRGAQLLDAVQALDPRLKLTPRPVLAQHDQAACAGLLRQWVQTIDWLDQFEVTGAVDTQTFAHVTSRMPPPPHLPSTPPTQRQRRK